MSTKFLGNTFIGTSNIVLPGSKQTFPLAFQQKSRLHYYSSLFNSLEVNSSFYKLPMPATFKKWAMDVPEDFRFTLKISKEISHAKALKFSPTLLNKFLAAAAGIGNKKGCLLLQFPGKITLDYYNEVENILHSFSSAETALQWPIAAEFRHPGWYVSECFELLNEYHATLVQHDHPKARNVDFNKNARLVYLRFHGPEGNYRGSYTTEFLRQQAEKVMKWKRQGSDVYAYFNNTMGSAFQNAQALQQLVTQEILPAN